MTKFHGGDAYNVIPEQVELAGTVRTLAKEVAAIAQERMRADLRPASAAAFGATIHVDYDANYPVTVNHPEETVFASDVAAASPASPMSTAPCRR